MKTREFQGTECTGDGGQLRHDHHDEQFRCSFIFGEERKVIPSEVLLVIEEGAER
jgi:hypothetical protein